MSLRRTAWVLGCLILVAGCAQSPVPINRPLVAQETMTGAEHWRILAEDTARHIDGCLAGRTMWDHGRGVERPICRHSVAGIDKQPLFVERADGAMPFARAFYDYLTMELLNRGRQVSLASEGAAHVRTRIQLVPRAGRVPVDSFPGPFTVLGAGIFALGDFDVVGPLVGAGALADLYFNANAYGGAQVLISTALTASDRLVMQRTDGYYVHDADLAHYASLAPRADLVPPLPAKGTPPAVKAFRVVGE